MNSIRIIFFLLSFLMVWQARSQDCPQQLDQAQEAFDNGQIELIPDLLNGCIENDGFNRNQLSQAYKLLVLTHIYDNEPVLAELTMLELLRNDPLFEVDTQNDPSEFIHLYSQFRTDPILLVGINVGLNTQIFNVMKNFGPENQLQAEESYKGPVAIVYGLGVEYPINKKWSVTGDLNLASRRTKIENDGGFLFPASIEVEEDQTWIDLMLMGKYYLLKTEDLLRKDGKILPFVKLGATFNYLATNNARLVTNTDIIDVDGPTEKFGDFKNNFQIGAVAAGGAEYHFGKNIIQVTLNFQYMFGNLVDPESRESSQAIRILTTYGYQENDYRAHTISAMVGYRLKIFNPKKLD